MYGHVYIFFFFCVCEMWLKLGAYLIKFHFLQFTKSSFDSGILSPLSQVSYEWKKGQFVEKLNHDRSR